jgi:tight adherence protein C
MPLTVLIILVFVGIASMLFFLMYMIIPKKTDVEERLDSLATTTEELSVFEKPPTGMQKILARLGAKVPLRLQDYGKYMRVLVAAGIKKERLPVFMGSKIVLAVILPVLYNLLYGIPIEKDPTVQIIFTAILAILGFLLPTYWLRYKLKQRKTRIFHDLPDVLDLMMVCVESGISMDASMIKVCEDPLFEESPLITEMKITLQETRAGKPRVEALRDLGERPMESDLKSFAAMLVQTERLGTSLVQSMRVHSDSLRTIRRQRAEETAAKIAIKLLFPLAFFIFPALLVVILGPAYLRIMKMFGEF